MFFGNYRKFPQQEPTSKNFVFKNYLNNSPKSLDRETFSQDKPARKYPLVVPSRQVFNKSENLFFRNPRDKYSESLSEDYKRTKDYEKIEEDPMSKVLVVYRADSDTKPSWKNSRETSNVIQPERSFPKENIYRLSREDILDEERNTIKKSSNSVSQLTYPQERYNLMGLGPSEVKRTPHVKDTDITKSTKEFFNNWDIAKDSSQFSNFEQFRNNLLEVHPAKKPEIITKNNNKQINFNSYNSKFPQGLNTWKSRTSEESLDSLKINTRPFINENDEDMKEYFENEPEYLMNEEDMKDYFEDEIGHNLQDIVEQDTIERDNNLHDVPQNIWKDIENEELLDDLDFMRENSRKTEQSGLYSEENDKYFQDEQNEDVIFQDKEYTSAEVVRAPVINAYNAYILPRNLNIMNDKKYSAKSETQELSEAKNSIRVNPIKEMLQRREDKAENNTHIQDLILPKDIFVEEYSSPIADKNNLRNKNEALIELDPDLLDDIEDPPVETTESTPT